MLVYQYVITSAGVCKSENILEMSTDYLRNQAFFLHREEQVVYRKHILLSFERYLQNRNKCLDFLKSQIR